MVSHKYRFLFIHYPKTAGCSVGYKLKSQNIVKNFIPQVDIHYETKYDVKRAIENNYFIFTTKRNPFDRLVSLWKYWNKRLKEENATTFAFSNFVSEYDRIKDKIKDKFGEKEAVHFIPMNKFINRISFELLNIEDVDFFMEFADIYRDWKIVCKKLNIHCSPLRNRNSTKHKHYTEYYDDETRQIVAEKYAKDIEYFNYKFGE